VLSFDNNDDDEVPSLEMTSPTKNNKSSQARSLSIKDGNIIDEENHDEKSIKNQI
jgi:hypothetical protein